MPASRPGTVGQRQSWTGGEAIALCDLIVPQTLVVSQKKHTPNHGCAQAEMCKQTRVHLQTHTNKHTAPTFTHLDVCADTHTAVCAETLSKQNVSLLMWVPVHADAHTRAPAGHTTAHSPWARAQAEAHTGVQTCRAPVPAPPVQPRSRQHRTGNACPRTPRRPSRAALHSALSGLQRSRAPVSPTHSAGCQHTSAEHVVRT